ncbi:amidohydrolase family protein [Ferruginibacter paludis]|uniref:amidohydrolase family protein n=1 Tax=Ferruginibacter paludis TaxID=1310417 RepID=UPI0025B58C91|nr:amidohydrolase family protein [Ferruginibacter paludis]MDN3654082.1 amidohydrolase family protein [Ferruginibacter paludis]
MHTPKFAFDSPIRSLLTEGILVGISPDGTTNPFWDIMVITSQQANPDENISIEQAVIAYTKTNAFAEFKENEKGMLVKGMLADLTVLSQDIFSTNSTTPGNYKCADCDRWQNCISIGSQIVCQIFP